MEGIKMKRLLVACFLLAGCATQSATKERFLKQRFVTLDEGFKASARADPPRVFVDANEMVKEKAPPYRFIGVVEVENIQTERLSVFFERVAKAGQALGCEAMLQRDAFQGTAPDPTPIMVKPSVQSMGGIAAGVSSGGGTNAGGNSAGGSLSAGGGGVYHNNMAIWQFLCGVGGATQEQAEATFKKADALAVKMRVAVLGFEPCAPYTPLGSHVRKVRVCADDPKGRNRPDATSFDR
jgi:hypothetical protein